MKKAMMMGVILAGALGAFAVLPDGSYLYWMVDTEATKDFTYDKVQVRAFETEKGVDSGSALTLYYGNGNEAGTYVSAERADGGLPFYASLVNAYGNSYSYVIELFNDSVKVGQSDSLLYTEAMAQNYATLMTSSGTIPSLATWSPSSYTAVPEPSSAMLVILGCAALALRRRKADTRG